MEYEVRFYYESEELKNILKGLKGESGLKEQQIGRASCRERV